jgi:hypothetical protein
VNDDPRGESMERIQALGRGERGERGADGQPGPAGKRGPESSRRLPAVAYLFILNFVLIVLGYLWLSHTVDRLDQVGQRVTQSVAANHAQRCSGLEQDARIPLLKGAGRVANPSRYDINIMILSARNRAEKQHC